MPVQGALTGAEHIRTAAAANLANQIATMAVSFVVLAIEDGLLEVVLLDQLLEQPRPLDLRFLAQISAVQPEQIEGEVNQSVLIASAEVRLQLGEIRALLMVTTTSPSTMACPSISKAPPILENLLTQL
jgi:hypothetical protein